MRNVYTFLFGIIALSATATAARADAPNPPFVRGSYCSAAASDGNWGFTWSLSDVFFNCNLVRNALASRTLAPITRWQRGYYWADAVNQVSVSCWGGSTFFTGIGANPLQNAYNYAALYNAQGCTFWVN